MYVSYLDKAVFFHNPRTGGTSLLKLLRNHSDFDEQLGSHESLSDSLNTKLKQSELWKKSFKFGFIRNPWSRLYSAFNYISSGGLNFEDARVSNIFVDPYQGDFNDFVKNHKYWFMHHCDFVSYKHKKSPHFLPQHFLITDKGSAVLDYVGNFESYKDCVRYIFDRLAFTYDPEAWALNSKKVDYYREAYNTESIDIVSKLYEKDISLFDYTFD